MPQEANSPISQDNKLESSVHGGRSTEARLKDVTSFIYLPWSHNYNILHLQYCSQSFP